MRSAGAGLEEAASEATKQPRRQSGKGHGPSIHARHSLYMCEHGSHNETWAPPFSHTCLLYGASMKHIAYVFQRELHNDVSHGVSEGP